MNTALLSRRGMLALGLSALPAALFFDIAGAADAPGRPFYKSGLAALDRFIEGYRAAMNAPGLTLAVADTQGPIRIASYGYVDKAAKSPVLNSHLFEIGSITKSFVALIVLQMHEEGKIDLQAPIRDRLPWLAMQDDFGEILIHHLLTHSSGMPEDAPLFPSDPGRRPRQAFRPGSQFHYSNWGFDVLGHLIETVDRRSWPAALSARILKPIGMDDTAPVITSDVRPRIAGSYVPLHDDRPYPRHGPMVPAGNLAVEFAAGSIASTPQNMTSYMRMILNRGAISGGRIISEESFKLFSTAHIAAPPFGPSAGYGYGIAVDSFDGHVRLRHTGGMVSFMSAMQLDLDAGSAAFASINAQLGYRPNPVVQFALQVLRSASTHAPVPPLPPFDESEKVDLAQSFAGTYIHADGHRLEVAAHSNSLELIAGDRRIPLQQSDTDTFIADQSAFDLFPVVFERTAADDPAGKAPPPIVALSHGADWFAREGHDSGAALQPSPELAAFTGEYYSENPWMGTVRIVQRQRQLWMGGTEPMTPIGNRLFRIGAQASSPEAAEFSELVDGNYQLLWLTGNEFRRT
jgi:CubicO group peptidase (beta-lactamase class C family)